MDEERYTPGQVWSVLTGETNDPDELADVGMALDRLAPQQRVFLLMVAQGYTAQAAMEWVGLHVNQTRYKRDALTRLTELVNGEKDGKEDSADK